MKRYIDANELMKLIPSEEMVSKYAVANAPTVDAVEVVQPKTCAYWDRESNFCALYRPSAQPDRERGKWVKISPANIFECSKCGKNVMTNDISEYNFCHGCGAKMDGERREDDGV